MVYVENDGALFRGISRSHPSEVWFGPTKGWVPYTFEGAFKPVEWGTEISQPEADRIIADRLGMST